jgi:hypothetical protein
VALLGGKDAPERPVADVLADVRNIARPKARVVEALDRVVDVQTVAGLGRGFDVPRSSAMAQLTASSSAREAM